MRTRIAVALLLVCACVGNAFADGRLWTYDAPTVITDYRLSPLGDLLVTTPKSIIALDTETGAVKWQREDLHPKETGLTMLPLTPSAIVRDGSDLTVVNLETGETRWNMSSLPVEKIHGFLPVPQIGALLVFGEADGSDKAIALVDLATGETRWLQTSILKKKPDTECYSTSERKYVKCPMFAPQQQTMLRHQRPVVHGDGIVFYVSKDGLIKVEAGTGRLMWKVKKLEGKSPPMRGKGYAPYVVADDVIFVPYDRKLVAVNHANGSVAWHHDKKFKSHIRQMEMSIEGLVLMGYKDAEEYTEPQMDGSKVEKVDPARDFFMDVLVPESGISSWEDPLEDMDMPLPFLVDEDYAFVPRSKDVILVDLQQGQYTQFAKLHLEDDELPTHVERVGSNYLVASPQNMVLLKSRGGLRYHTYYEAPGASFLQKFLLITSGFILDEAFDTEIEEPQWTTEGSVTTSFAARPFQMASIEACRERFKLTSEGDKYRYIYTGEPLGDRKGYSLVKVDKATGKEAGRIWIDKQFPNYKIDLATETVFAIEGNSRVFAIR